MDVVLPKIEHYQKHPAELPKEVRDLNAVPKPVLVLDDATEILQTAFRRSFDRASSALQKVTDATADSPLTVDDIGVYAKYLNDQVDSILCQFATKEELQTVSRAVTERRYTDLFSTEFCSVCREERVDIGDCKLCSAKMCSSCFADQLTTAAEDGWTDVSMISRLATLRCDFCKTGSIDPVIRQQLSMDAAELYVKAVEYNARAGSAKDARMEKRRECRAYRGLPDKEEKQYQTEKQVLLEMVGVQCPSCALQFADYDGCCSLQCSSCSVWFCALCFYYGDGDWSRYQCHRHVKDCMDRPADMDDEHFYPLELWKKHTAMRQHRLCAKYLEKSDLSPALKSRLLLNEFPRP